MKLLRKILIIANIITLIPLLLADVAPFFPPTWWWVPNFLTYFLPYLLIIPVAWFFIWFFPDFRIGFINVILFVLNIPNIIALYQISYDKPVPKSDFKVVSFNVGAFGYNYKTFRKHIIYYKKWDADILCLQEFLSGFNKKNYLKEIKRKCGYKYHYFVELFPKGFGLAIFSKFPIVGKGKVTSTKVPVKNGIIFADVYAYGETLRVYNAHLQSYNLSNKERKEENAKKKRSLLKILIKLVKGWKAQYVQALRLKFHRKIFPQKYTIICSDLNNPPGSYFYYNVRSNLKDAFIKKGNGQGHTFYIYNKGFRIDYIFTSGNLKVLKFKEIKTKLSDHFPIFAKINYNFH